jgi:hypothetical protein
MTRKIRLARKTGWARRILLSTCQEDDSKCDNHHTKQGQYYLAIGFLQIKELTDHITPN